MKNSRLLIIFNQLSKKDLRALSQFVRSPFFNKQEKTIQLFDYLETYSLSLSLIPTKQKAFQEIFPDKFYDDQKMRLLMSSLSKLIEHFIAYQELFGDEMSAKVALTKGFRRRGISDAFQRSLKEAKKMLEKHPHKNAEYYRYKYLLQLEVYQFTSTKQPTGELNMQEMSDTIDIAYLTLKLRQSCFLLSHQSVYKTKYQIGFIEEVISYIERQEWQQTPSISVYYYCYKTLTEPKNENHFKEFKQLLFLHGQIFPAAEIRDLYLLAINYCVKQINEAIPQYFYEVMDLYKEGLKTKYLMDEGILSRFTYHNIAAAGIKIKDFEWVEQFIKEYQGALAKPYRDSSYSFNLARLKYSRKDYDAALSLLQKSNYKDLLLNLAAKVVLMKIFLELGELDLLHSHLEAMKTFIRRKHVIGYHKENYLNIIRYTKKLIALNPYDKEKYRLLRKAIADEDILSEKDWLLGQFVR
ncbi:MAG: hypothetical protein GY705_16625 [Bacteroidetes bacterium]|nr:hypothetical protein [Bacteroidota bacterium]